MLTFLERNDSDWPIFYCWIIGNQIITGLLVMYPESEYSRQRDGRADAAETLGGREERRKERIL